MRCKKHLPDQTSTVGVCSSCLRERLQAVLDVEIKAQAQTQAKADLNPMTPPNFPRSESRRREAGTNLSDVGPATTKQKPRKFWILSSVFRSRSNKTEMSSCEPSSSVTPPSSTWLSTFLPARKQTDRRKTDKGASPAVTENFGIDGQNRSVSGCSSESSPRRTNQTAAAAPARRTRLGPKSLASMAFCLSPLVRASPNRNWKKGFSQELGISGGTHKLSNAAAFCASRSRKLADFGRVVTHTR